MTQKYIADLAYKRMIIKHKLRIFELDGNSEEARKLRQAIRNLDRNIRNLQMLRRSSN